MPEPITSTLFGLGGLGVLSAAVINSYGNAKISKANRELQERLAINNQELQERLANQRCQLDVDLARARFQEERWKLALQLRHQSEEAELSRVFTHNENVMANAVNLAIAKMNAETTSSEGEKNRAMNEYFFAVNQIREQWPLRISPTQFLRPRSRDNLSDVNFEPLRVIISPASVKHDVAVVSRNSYFEIEEAATSALRKYVTNQYGLSNDIRPLELLDGAWSTARYHGGAAINNIYCVMKRVPTLILETQECGDYIEFNFAYWNGFNSKYEYQHVSRIDCQKLVARLCRQQVSEWKESNLGRQILGYNSTDEALPPAVQQAIHNWCSGIETNFGLYQTERRFAASDAENDLDRVGLYRNYVVTDEVRSKLQQIFGAIHAVYVSIYADLHHLMTRVSQPALPATWSRLQDYLQPLPEELTSSSHLIAMYSAAYRTLLRDIPSDLIRLQYAQVLARLGDRDVAQLETQSALKGICTMLGVSDNDDIKETAQRILAAPGTSGVRAILRETVKVVSE